MPKSPSRLALLGELRAPLEFSCGMIHALRKPKKSLVAAPPIIVFPGFGFGDDSTHKLRTYLQRCGAPNVQGWKQGKNLAGLDIKVGPEAISKGWNIDLERPYNGEGGVAALCDKLAVHVRNESERLNKKVALVGWSLGGYVAREVARDLPECVDRVITFGTPVLGGPKYTAAASKFSARGMDLDWIEQSVLERYKKPIVVPVTAIVSKNDGIVDYSASVESRSPQIEVIEISASHLGMGFNPTVWKHVAESLR